MSPLRIHYGHLEKEGKERINWLLRELMSTQQKDVPLSAWFRPEQGGETAFPYSFSLANAPKGRLTA